MMAILREVPTGKERGRFSAGTVYTVAFSPDGKLLATGGGRAGSADPADTAVILWDLGAGKELRRLGGHRQPVSRVAFLPDGKWLASGSYDSTVLVWDVGGARGGR